MSTYSANSDKSTGSQEAVDWYDCGAYEAGPNTGHSPDGINGSLSIKKRDREAMGVEQGDEVLVRAKANGKEIFRPRKIVANGRQVTLPAEARRELNLSVGDTVEFAILPLGSKTRDDTESKNESEEDQEQTEEDPAKKKDDTQDESEDDSAEEENSHSGITSENGQQKLVEDDALEIPYVLVKGGDTDPWTYHRIQPDNTQETVCGIKFSNQKHRTLAEPSDFEPCPFCTAPSPEQSASEKQQWLGQIAGFEVNENSTATYIKNEQYDALIGYILDLREKMKTSK